MLAARTIVAARKALFAPSDPADYPGFKITAGTSGASFHVRRTSSSDSNHQNSRTAPKVRLEYARTGGLWRPLDFSRNSDHETPVVSMGAGETVMLRRARADGIGSLSEGVPNMVYLNALDPGNYSRSTWFGTTLGPYAGCGVVVDSQFVSVSGDASSLLAHDRTTQCPPGAFAGLFEGCTGLVDASELVLPAMSLSSGCYFAMFRNCSYLTGAPTLPATSLGPGCYAHMFDGCTSLSRAPVLPATANAAADMQRQCYNSMFLHCSSLTEIAVFMPGFETNHNDPRFDFTYNWVSGIGTGSGDFYCSFTVPERTEDTVVHTVPANWTVHPLSDLDASSGEDESSEEEDE